MISQIQFPRLTPQNHRVTSPASPDYNCIAWAAGQTSHWWEPGLYWPMPTSPGDYGIPVLEQAFAALGYLNCSHGALETGFEKVVLYGSSLFFTHVARQLPNGRWTGKLGGAEDVEHDTPDDVTGGVYGEVVQFMRRATS